MNAAYAYSAYGLNVRANREIPGLVELSQVEDKNGDLYLELVGPCPSQGTPKTSAVLRASPERDERGEPFFKACRFDGCNPASMQMRWCDGEKIIEFLVDGAGHRVRATWSEAVPYAEVVSPLLGPVLGCVLRQRGITCLHASAVTVGHGASTVAIAIVAAKYGGKSTLAAALAGRGHSVLADDLVVLTEGEQGLMVQPGYPRLRLWPDSASALPGIDTDSLEHIWPDMPMDKRFLDLNTDPDNSRWRFQARSAPLVGVYLLDDPGPVDTVPRVTPIPPATGMIALAQNTYVDYVLDRTGRARDLQVLARLAATIPLRQVDRPASMEGLAQTCEVILDDVQATRGSFAGKGS